MTKREAINLIDIIRMGYICDPQECGEIATGGTTYEGELCDIFKCYDYHDACVMAMEALEIADRLKRAITDEQTADCIIVDAECVNNKHDKEVWLNGYNQALADIRGEEE